MLAEPGSFRLKAQDPALRPELKEQALHDLRKADARLEALKQAGRTSEIEQIIAESYAYQHHMQRRWALHRLEILREFQHWTDTANDWLAVVACWIFCGYGIFWGFVVLFGSGPTAALLHVLKAATIAVTLLLVGYRITALLARSSR